MNVHAQMQPSGLWPKVLDTLRLMMALVAMPLLGYGMYLHTTAQRDTAVVFCFVGFTGFLAFAFVITAHLARLKRLEVEGRFTRVQARCLRHEIGTCAAECGDSYEVRLTCFYEMEGRPVESSPFVSFTSWASPAGAEGYFKNRVDPESRCTLAINPANPTDSYLLPWDNRSNRLMTGAAVVAIAGFVLMGIWSGLFRLLAHWIS